jgi:protein O-mannosyl-transferase
LTHQHRFPNLKPARGTDRHTAILFALVTAIIAAGVYAQTVNSQFVWDDVVVLDQQLPYFASLRDIFLPPTGVPQITNYYRPLIFLTYRLDEALAFSLWPAAEHARARVVTFHASCILYHAVATLLVFWLGLALTVDAPSAVRRAAATAGAVLFAVHPIHAESVAWMAGRSDVVCSIFLMGAVLTYLRNQRTGSWGALLATGTLALAAMLAKETGLALVVFLPLLDWIGPAECSAHAEVSATSSRAARRRASRTAAFATAPQSAIALAWRWSVLALALLTYVAIRRLALANMSAPALPQATFSMQTLLGALGWYVVKAFWPWPQSAFVTHVPAGPYIVIGVLALLALCFGLVTRPRPGWRAVLIGGALFICTLIPSLAVAVVGVSETPLAERYLYIPSIGLCLAAGLVLAQVSQRAAGTQSTPRAAMAWGSGLLMLIAVPAAWATARRAAVWQDNFVLWSDTVQQAPDAALPHLQLGTAYTGRGDNATAIEQYRLALATSRSAEGRSKALNNIGSRYAAMGQYPEAIEQFQKALVEVPQYPMAEYNWGLAAVLIAVKTTDQNERWDRIFEGKHHLETALQMNPRYVEAHLEYAQLLLNLGRNTEGIYHLHEVIRLAPASAAADVARGSLAKIQAAPG